MATTTTIISPSRRQPLPPTITNNNLELESQSPSLTVNSNVNSSTDLLKPPEVEEVEEVLMITPPPSSLSTVTPSATVTEEVRVSDGSSDNSKVHHHHHYYFCTHIQQDKTEGTSKTPQQTTPPSPSSYVTIPSSKPSTSTTSSSSHSSKSPKVLILSSLGQGLGRPFVNENPPPSSSPLISAGSSTLDHLLSRARIPFITTTSTPPTTPPITPPNVTIQNQPITSGTAPNGPNLSSASQREQLMDVVRNAAALVRTISNGSTFGPINPPPLNEEIGGQSWPPIAALTAAAAAAVASSSSAAASTSTTTLINNFSARLSSLRSTSTQTTQTQTMEVDEDDHLRNRGVLQGQPLISSSNSRSSTLRNSTLNSTHSTVSPSNLSHRAMTFPSSNSVPRSERGSEVNNNSTSSSALNSNSTSTTSTTTTTIQPFPVQPTLLFPSDLPLVFGDRYILVSQMEASNLYRVIDKESKEEFCCKVLLSKSYNDFLAPHFRMDGHEGVNQVVKIVVGRTYTFILFEQAYGDLHSYVRSKRRIREPEAAALFQQVVTIVADCHANGIILRDLKLRKFIFSNREKTQLRLECLEGAALCEDGDDTLTDKHGCPAYVSPEILNCDAYSGMVADCWSLGVILYTMLTGRYPFHDPSPSVVFSKIRRGTFHMPDFLSRPVKCLIRSLIKPEPEVRLTSADALAHRWFSIAKSFGAGGVAGKSTSGNSGSLSSPPSPGPISASVPGSNQSQQPQFSTNQGQNSNQGPSSGPPLRQQQLQSQTPSTSQTPAPQMLIPPPSQTLDGNQSLPGMPLLTSISRFVQARGGDGRPTVNGAPVTPGTLGGTPLTPTSSTSSSSNSLSNSPSNSSSNSSNSSSNSSSSGPDFGLHMMPTRVMTRGPVIGPRMGPNHPPAVVTNSGNSGNSQPSFSNPPQTPPVPHHYHVYYPQTPSLNHHPFHHTHSHHQLHLPQQFQPQLQQQAQFPLQLQPQQQQQQSQWRLRLPSATFQLSQTAAPMNSAQLAQLSALPLRSVPYHSHDPFAHCTISCFHDLPRPADQIVPDLSLNGNGVNNGGSGGCENPSDNLDVCGSLLSGSGPASSSFTDSTSAMII